MVTSKIEPIQKPNNAKPKAKAVPYIHNEVRIISLLIILRLIVISFLFKKIKFFFK